MKRRCLNPKNPDYKSYGQRGIIIDPSWLEFDNFIRDMGIKPDPKLMLERRDNEQGYTPSNCYWATASEQQKNRRRFGSCQ
jgi:hypothetical protein